MKDTDRELLEMAAKAAGIPKSKVESGLAGFYRSDVRDTFGRAVRWNPLEDDGDALRLAATIRLSIIPGKHFGDGCSVNPTSHQTPGVTVFRDSKDMSEQMRHAIVRASAEIGKAMK